MQARVHGATGALQMPREGRRRVESGGVSWFLGIFARKRIIYVLEYDSGRGARL